LYAVLKVYQRVPADPPMVSSLYVRTLADTTALLLQETTRTKSWAQLSWIIECMGGCQNVQRIKCSGHEHGKSWPQLQHKSIIGNSLFQLSWVTRSFWRVRERAKHPTPIYKHYISLFMTFE